MDTSPLLERYRGIVNDALLTQIYEVAAPLSGLHVLHINTTAQGGGVAEILDELIPQANALGIRHSRQVVPLDDASSTFTARLVDMLQGYDTGSFPDDDKTVFLDKLQHAISHSSEWQ